MFVLIKELSLNTCKSKKGIALVMKEDGKCSYQQWFSSHANKLMVTFQHSLYGLAVVLSPNFTLESYTEL